MSLKILLLVALATTVGWLQHGTAFAQIPPIPSTVFGSIADSEGEIPPGVPVVAYIGDTVCSIDDDVVTVLSGDGDAEVTLYVIEVVADGQVEGCGDDDARVRIKIGDRLSEDTIFWRQGPVRFDITFGDAEPAPIPTFTPTATAVNTATPAPATATPNSAESSPTSVADETSMPDGSSTPVGPSGTATEPEDTPSPTLTGGVTTNNASLLGDDGGGGGFPIWGFGLIIVALIAVVGGGLGFFLSRNPEDDVPLPPDEDL